jgi:hypothetical protein
MRIKVVFLLTVVFFLMLTFGCSGSDGVPAAPEGEGNPQDVPNGFPPQYFIIEFNPDDWAVEIHSKTIPREGLFDVTKWANITITDATWVPSERNWYITAQIRNTTHFKGYGVWGVFTEMGEKEVRDID